VKLINYIPHCVDGISTPISYNLLFAQIKTEFPVMKLCFHHKFFHSEEQISHLLMKNYSHFFNFILCSRNCGSRNVSVKPVNTGLENRN
jgi:hypothetical protein